MSTTTERKYALTKVANGDYLLPSNDATTLWRIHRYTDGPSFGLMDYAHDFQRWALRKWYRPVSLEHPYIDVDDWDRWESVEDGFETRREAIAAALNAQ